MVLEVCADERWLWALAPSEEIYYYKHLFSWSHSSPIFMARARDLYVREEGFLGGEGCRRAPRGL